MTEAQAARIRHLAAPAVADFIESVLAYCDEASLDAAAPTTPTRRAAHTPDKRRAPAASPAAEEAVA